MINKLTRSLQRPHVAHTENMGRVRNSRCRKVSTTTTASAAIHTSQSAMSMDTVALLSIDYQTVPTAGFEMDIFSLAANWLVRPIVITLSSYHAEEAEGSASQGSSRDCREEEAEGSAFQGSSRDCREEEAEGSASQDSSRDCREEEAEGSASQDSSRDCHAEEAEASAFQGSS